MLGVEICAVVREAVGGSSKFTACEAQLVVEILQVMGRANLAKMLFVDELWMVRSGDGRRIVNCKRKRVRLTLTAQPFQRKVVINVARALEVSEPIKKQRYELQRTMERYSTS